MKKILIVGGVAGGARTFVIVLFIYGVMSIFSPVLPSEWMKNSVAMKGASVVWPSVSRIMTDKGWLDPSKLTPQDIGNLPDYLNAAPTSDDM